jgi:hypothetical protein
VTLRGSKAQAGCYRRDPPPPPAAAAASSAAGAAAGSSIDGSGSRQPSYTRVAPAGEASSGDASFLYRLVDADGDGSWRVGPLRGEESCWLVAWDGAARPDHVTGQWLSNERTSWDPKPVRLRCARRSCAPASEADEAQAQAQVQAQVQV